MKNRLIVVMCLLAAWCRADNDFITDFAGADVNIGERLFLESRFSQYYFTNSGGDANTNIPGDPLMATLSTVTGPVAGPFVGQAMNCRQCHLVDEKGYGSFGDHTLGNRTYADFARHSPVPLRDDGRTQTPRNAQVLHVLNAMIELQAGTAIHEAASFMNLSNVLIRCVADAIRTPVSQTVHPAQNLLDSVCVYLQNHYQYDITRDSVARQFEVSPNHLSRIFRTQGHMTFNDYLTHVRIDRGKYLLCHYNLKIEDVAGRCGYSNAAYFGRVFKRVTRSTPAEYRSVYYSRKAAGDRVP